MTRQGFLLMEAAERYGDAKVEHERLIKAWKRGDPPLEPFERELDWMLMSAARNYATSTRQSHFRVLPVL